jgi:yersiniabactin nonribosomal peptide synthetase
LEQLRENGIQIWGEGEKIRYRSKNRQLAPETLRILKMAKGQILDFFRMIEKNVIPLTSIQTAYVVGQTAGCELGNINAHYYIEYTIESLDVERLEQMINLVISKNDALRLIVTHEGKASFR